MSFVYKGKHVQNQLWVARIQENQKSFAPQTKFVVNLT